MSKSKFKKLSREIDEEAEKVQTEVQRRLDEERTNLDGLIEHDGFIPEEESEFEEYNYSADDFTDYIKKIAMDKGLDEHDAIKLRDEYYAELVEIGLSEDDFILDSEEKNKCFNDALKIVEKQKVQR